MNQVQIGSHILGANRPPLIVAELSGNHNGSLDRALRIIDAAADAGAHAVKFQTYTPDTMTIDIREREFKIKDQNSLWSGRNLYDLYREAHTPWEWHEALVRRARDRGLLWFSSPFDKSAVTFLEGLEAPAYKISSFEILDLPLIESAARTGKPVIISTGMASISEIAAAVDTVKKSGNDQLVLLQCTSNYPAHPAHARIRNIPLLRDLFQCPVGLSDHTAGIGVAVGAVVLGAVMLEKHFTDTRSNKGVDSEFSMDSTEMAALVSEALTAYEACADSGFGPTDSEKSSLVFRRTLYVVKDMMEGEAFTEENLRSIRPGLGLPPGHLPNLIGRTAKKPIRRGTPLTWDLLA